MFNLFDRKTCMMRSASGNCKPAHRLCESVHRTTCNELRRAYCLGIVVGEMFMIWSGRWTYRPFAGRFSLITTK